ncbi:hypothetical protein QEN19_002795 [Hanseniaspora menglaensis]
MFLLRANNLVRFSGLLKRNNNLTKIPVFLRNYVKIVSEDTPNENAKKYFTLNNKILFVQSRFIIEVSRDDPSSFKYDVLGNVLLKNVPELDSVMINDKFVTCVKNETCDWYSIDEGIKHIISDYLDYKSLGETKKQIIDSKESKSIERNLFAEEQVKIDSLANEDEISFNNTDSKNKFSNFEDINEAEIEKAKKFAHDQLKEQMKTNFKFRELTEEEQEIEEDVIDLLETRVKPNLMEDGGDISYQGYDPDTGTIFVKLHGSCKSCSLSSATLQNGVENMIKHYIPEIEKVQQILSEQDAQSELQMEKLEEKLTKGSKSTST